jgi:SAM-dependent methyltransferase
MQSAQFLLHADIEERHWWFVGRRRIMRRLLTQVLPPSHDVTVVDIGCGTGANIASLADHYDCAGIDASPEAIDLARQRFPAVRFLVGLAPRDLGDLARQARAFLLMDVLEHVEDDFALLSGLLGAASPGVHFLITVPADEALWSEHDESFGHYRRYDQERFERVWAGLPVTPLVSSYFNSRMYPLVRLIRARNRRRGHAGGRAGTDFWMPNHLMNHLLEATLAGEAGRLLGQLAGGRQGYSYGASLMALLRREEGPISVRGKPDGLTPDHPVAGP